MENNDLVREQLNDVAMAVHQLPLWVFQQVRSMTVQEIAESVLDVKWEDEVSVEEKGQGKKGQGKNGKAEKKGTKKKAPPRAKAKKKATKNGKSKKADKHVPGTNRPKSTVELDERVLAILKATNEDTPITLILTALDSKFRDPDDPDDPLYNAQQVRRSLVRMIKGGSVAARGKTKNKVYRAL